MHCQRRILSVKWYNRVRNTEVSSLTGLESMSTIISRRRSSLFWDVVRLASHTPANQPCTESHCWRKTRFTSVSFQEATKRYRPCYWWLKQLTQDGSCIDELWAAAVRMPGAIVCRCYGSHGSGVPDYDMLHVAANKDADSRPNNHWNHQTESNHQTKIRNNLALIWITALYHFNVKII